jgi:hypothetical protein
LSKAKGEEGEEGVECMYCQSLVFWSEMGQGGRELFVLVMDDRTK